MPPHFTRPDLNSQLKADLLTILDRFVQQAALLDNL